MSTHDPGTCDWLAGELARSFVLERPALDPVLGEFRHHHPYADANALASELVRRGLLTPFQAERALEGLAKSLLLGPYVLVESVGTGSMGSVFRAAGRADRLAYAVRVLPKRGTWNVRLARKQVRAFGELTPHPAVVPFIDVGTAAGLHYLVWPFVEGASLDALIRRHGPADPAWVARVGLQLAEGLDACHAGGVFHGLLKPTNVLVGGDNQVRILDFGLGALLAENPDESMIDTMSAANATSGMVDCACPESMVDPAGRGPAGDQYSLGCVLYFALTGRLPFPDGNMVQKVMAHQGQQPTPVRQLAPQVPAGLAGVVERLLQKTPAGRFASASELAGTLRLLTGTPAPTTPARPSSDLTRSGVRPPPAPPAELPTPPPGALAPPPPPLPRVTVPRRGVVDRFLAALAFWRPPADGLACTVFAPAKVRVGESFMVVAYPHDPAVVEAVASLAKAVAPTADHARAAALTRPIPRGSQLGVHLGAGPLGVDQPLQAVSWKGSPTGVRFRLYVPRDCPPGPVVGAVSLGLNNKLVARVEFPLTVVPPGR